MIPQTLYIISASYPYGNGEEFMSKEIKELSNYFSKIYLFPLKAIGDKRSLPDNVILNISLASERKNINKKEFFFNSFLLLKILGVEFFKSDKKRFVISNLRELANSILQAKLLSKVFVEQIHDMNSCFYSVWMDDGALMLSILKRENKIKKFVFRLHGYDLFDERRIGGYMPFRYFNFMNAHRIFVLSKAGYDYLIKKNIFREKLLINYSGVYDNGTNPFNPTAIFTIVSCSNVINIKRLDKIIEVLSLIDFPVHWVHFGDGELLDNIKQKAVLLPAQITCSFKGHVRNDELLMFYRSVSVNLFIHLSDTEGLGMAIVEAQSFGIPALAVNVGGVSEVVNEETGILVSLTTSIYDIAESVKIFKMSNKNAVQYRLSVRENWKKVFDAHTNYAYFYKKLLE
jgi:glycosyltransferase involved in cell wall biosynthesis